MSKILLINPHSPEFCQGKEKYVPLSMLYISSYLKKHGHQVVFVDLNCMQTNCFIRGDQFKIEDFYPFKIGSTLSDFKPDCIGITVHFSGRLQPAVEICRKIKMTHPDMPIILGGIHPTIHAFKILEDYECVDYILQGEAENTLLEFMEFLGERDSSVSTIDGIAFRQNGEIVVREKAHFIHEVDDIPFPDYDCIDIKDYYFDTSSWYNPKGLPINFNMHILSGRSCPRKCTFCSMYRSHGPVARLRSAKNVLDEIEYLYHKFDQRYFSFMDDNFTINRVRTLEICKGIIDRDLDIQFDTPNGLEIITLDEEILGALVNAGLVRCCLAVESGSPVIRKSIHKALPQAKIYDAYNALKKFPSLKYNTFFIVGFPNETAETLEETYQLIKTLELKSAVISFATPFPGTQLFKECVENNLIELPTSDLHKFDNFFYGHKEPFIKPYRLEKQDLVDFRLKVYTELHLDRYLEQSIA